MRAPGRRIGRSRSTGGRPAPQAPSPAWSGPSSSRPSRFVRRHF